MSKTSSRARPAGRCHVSHAILVLDVWQAASASHSGGLCKPLKVVDDFCICSLNLPPLFYVWCWRPQRRFAKARIKARRGQVDTGVPGKVRLGEAFCGSTSVITFPSPWTDVVKCWHVSLQARPRDRPAARMQIRRQTAPAQSCNPELIAIVVSGFTQQEKHRASTPARPHNIAAVQFSSSGLSLSFGQAGSATPTQESCIWGVGTRAGPLTCTHLHTGACWIEVD